MHDTLDAAVDATHEVLAERRRKASAAVVTATGRRDVYRLNRHLLSSMSRHLAAVNAVLLPAAKKVGRNGLVALPGDPRGAGAPVTDCSC